MNDIINFKKQNFNNIFISVDKDNLYKIKAMIIGPKNTPYQNGFYFFDVLFPENYPNKNPKVEFKTIDGNVRFNPNLYQNGKVCLSILGTWSGPGWQPTMTLTSVLLSIQSLLQENPIVNEPGFEKIKITDDKAQNYNKYLTYYNFKLAIYDVLKHRKFASWRRSFKSEIKNILDNNLQNIKDEAETYNLLLDGLTIPKSIYFMSDTDVKFKDLCKDILKL
jgi:ubiquitin-conjugating enzyme E2 Z